jgi:hypothetical protein
VRNRRRQRGLGGEQSLNERHEFVEPGFERRRERVEPMHAQRKILEVLVRVHVLESKRDDDLLPARRDLEFAQDVFGGIALVGEDEQHGRGIRNRVHELPCVRTRADVTRRDPAAHVGLFQFGARS